MPGGGPDDPLDLGPRGGLGEDFLFACDGGRCQAKKPILQITKKRKGVGTPATYVDQGSVALQLCANTANSMDLVSPGHGASALLSCGVLNLFLGAAVPSPPLPISSHHPEGRGVGPTSLRCPPPYTLPHHQQLPRCATTTTSIPHCRGRARGCGRPEDAARDRRACGAEDPERRAPPPGERLPNAHNNSPALESLASSSQPLRLAPIMTLCHS